MTWAELIEEVRAQLDVTEDEAYAWLLDRARVMNAEAAWNLHEITLPVTTAETEYALPADCLKTEAVVLGTTVYRRSTLGQLDYARMTYGSAPIYADGVDEEGANLIQIHPPSEGGLTLRYLADVPDNRTGSPPFPADVHQAIADGAIEMGLGRVDERFDSAQWFGARFTDGIARLKRRRHAHVGRGGTPIRVMR